jgi:hypothetical protein
MKYFQQTKLSFEGKMQKLLARSWLFALEKKTEMLTTR